jgi:hypothetical protein
VERSLNRQKVDTRDLVVLKQTIQASIEIAHRSIQVGQYMQRVHQFPGIFAKRRNRKRFLERGARRDVVTGRLQDISEVGQADRDRQWVVPLAVEREHLARDTKCLGVAALVPAQKPDASQGASHQRGILALLGDAQCRAERAVCGVESLEQHG